MENFPTNTSARRNEAHLSDCLAACPRHDMSTWARQQRHLHFRSRSCIPEYAVLLHRPKSIVSQSDAASALALCDLEMKRALYHAISARAASANGIMSDNTFAHLLGCHALFPRFPTAYLTQAPPRAQPGWEPVSGLREAIDTPLDSFSADFGHHALYDRLSNVEMLCDLVGCITRSACNDRSTTHRLAGTIA